MRKQGKRGGEPFIFQGRIQTGGGPILVQIQRFQGDIIRSVDGAKIKIIDGQGNEESFRALGEGRYLAEGHTIMGKIGETYYIEVETGRGIYRSIPETIPQPAKITDFSFELTNQFVFGGNFATEKKFIEVGVDVALPESASGPYLRWEIEEGWKLVETQNPDPRVIPKVCYFREWFEPQDILLLNGERINTNKVENHHLISRIVDWSFFDKHVFAFYQQTLTGDAFAYWQDVDLLTDQVGSIFDVIPAGIRGNMYNVDDPEELVLGYFEAISVDTAIFSLTKNDLAPYRPIPRCLPSFQDYGFGQRIPIDCLFCLGINGASLDRPEFFDE